MYVLLQIYPPEASDDDDDPPLDVIAVNPSEAELEGYLVAYAYRYRAACEDFDAWDDLTGDWSEEHDRMCDVLLGRYQLYGSLIQGTKFEIVECLSGGRPFRDEEPEPIFPPVAASPTPRRGELGRSAGRRSIRWRSIVQHSISLERFGGLEADKVDD